MLHKYKFTGLTFTFDAFCETGFLWHQPFNYIKSNYIIAGRKTGRRPVDRVLGSRVYVLGNSRFSILRAKLRRWRQSHGRARLTSAAFLTVNIM